EGLTDAGCLDSPLPYDPGHNPFAFYGGACPSNVVPFTSMARDLEGGAPRFSWITPGRCHDTHHCDVSACDVWLGQTGGQITGASAGKSSGVLCVTWAENEPSADTRVLTLVVAPGLSHRTSRQQYTHYSLLATIEDLLGVRRLGQSASASPMSDLLPSTLSM